MGNGDSNGDYVYQLLELKIIEGLVPNERDLLQLKRVIDNENHENANWLLELLGIQQDSDKIIITRFEEARGMLRSMANNYVSTSTTLGGHQYDEHTFNGMASEQADEDAEVNDYDGYIF